MTVYLHTVFEGQSTNTLEAGLNFLEVTHGIDSPFYGHTSPADGNPAVFEQYNQDGQAGTPYSLVIDKDGTCVWHNFTSNSAQIISQILPLL